jgi:microcystin degradation protein MlrC
MEDMAAPVNEFLEALPKPNQGLGYIVNIPFRHSFAWGASQRTEVLTYWTRNLYQVRKDSLSDELAKVLESLGYWADSKPTEAAINLKDPRNAHVQILAYGVYVAPGPIHSTSDRRFQALIEDL